MLNPNKRSMVTNEPGSSTEKRLKENKIDFDSSTTDTQNFPEEILADIFTILNVPDKKRCSEVCWKWYEIMQQQKLSKDIVFRFSDIYFYPHCPPCSTFSGPKRKLLNVEFKLTEWLNRAGKFEGFTDFLKTIGHNTKFLRILEWAPVEKSLQYFPNLEEIYKPNLQYLTYCSEIPTSIKKIHVLGIQNEQDDNVMNLIRQRLPALEVIAAEKVKLIRGMTEWNVPEKKQLFMISEDLQCIRESPKFVNDFSIKAGVNFLNLDRFNSCDLELSVEFNPEMIAAFIEDASELKFSMDKSCFFVHDVVPFSNVRSVYLKDTVGTSCGNCLEFLVKSCPHIERLSLNLREIPVQLFAYTFTHLSVFTSNCAVSLDDIFVNSNCERLQTLHIGLLGGKNYRNWSEWPGMPNLRKLAFKLEKPSDIDFIGEIVQKCPQLRSFSLYGNGFIEDNNQIEVMVKGWPYLTHLEIPFDPHTSNPAEMRELLQEHCRELREIILEIVCDDPNVFEPNFEELLFKSVPTLRRVTLTGGPFISYKDYQKDEQ